MKPHIAQTIADLTQEVDRLKGIIEILTSYGNATAEPSSVPVRIIEPTDMVAAINETLTPPTTFAGAMKQVLREAAGGLTITQIFDAVQTRWPSILERDKGLPYDISNVEANIKYWFAQQKVDKHGIGAQATYTVVDKDFFQPIVE